MKLGDSCSTCLDISCGVPQGSVLGPKLFIMYINDISNISKILKLILFADDTNIFCTGDDSQLLLDEISSELCKLKIWFDINKSSLNLNKTKIMIFGNCRMNSQIDGVIIERVAVNTFLGVIIDETLSWKPHIKHIHSKVSRSIAVLNKAKQFLDNKSLRILYGSLVSPY